jgi:molybdopterin/thiamine biosynthesis adenylyltransferase
MHDDVVIAFAGEILIEGRQVTIHVGLDRYFPQSLPFVHLVPSDSLGQLPHVQYGFVCFSQTEGLFLDGHNPLGLIEEALVRSADTLAKGIRGDNRADFVDEFEVYLHRLTTQTIPSYISPTDELRSVVVALKGGTRDGYEFICDSEAEVRAYAKDNNRHQHTLVTALYIPLQQGTLLIPPPANTFWSLSEIQDIVQQHVAPKHRAELLKLCQKHKHQKVVVFKLPRTKEGEVLFGINFQGVERAHPLLPGSSVREISPLVLSRRDRAYILPRSGASLGLAQKRVAVIGCGSVGGFLAHELVRAGVLHLALIDKDSLSTDNTFRHVLGRKGEGNKKAEQLRSEIEQKYPYVSVQAIAKPIEQAIDSGEFRPKEWDLVISAVGHLPTNLHLNWYFHSNEGMPPLLFTWLEPYGIGGHAVTTLNPERRGCLECLYTLMPGDEQVTPYDRSSFAASGQSFAKDLSGCGSLFMPFGSLHATRTASLAAEIAIALLSGKVIGNQLASWKGDDTAFLEAGHQVSQRYNHVPDGTWKQLSEYHNPNCPVCGDKKSG